MTETDDPLDGAVIGETHTIRETQTLHGINMGPDVFWGSDRFGDADIVDVEIIETGDEDYNDIKVTWEGDITKRLPRRWDYHREPVTEAEKRTAARRKWLGRAAHALAVIVPVGLATWIGTHVTNAALSGMTINGEPMGGTATTVVDTASLVLIVMAISALIIYGMKGGFPGKVNP